MLDMVWETGKDNATHISVVFLEEVQGTKVINKYSFIISVVYADSEINDSIYFKGAFVVFLKKERRMHRDCKNQDHTKHEMCY